MAKIFSGEVYGDLRVVSKAVRAPSETGPYKYVCACIHCGKSQTRAHQNLMTSKHPRCLFCNFAAIKTAEGAAARKGWGAAREILIAFQSGDTLIMTHGISIPAALDRLRPDTARWLVTDQPTMFVGTLSEGANTLEGVDYSALLATYSLRALYGPSDAAGKDAHTYTLPTLTIAPAKVPTGIAETAEIATHKRANLVPPTELSLTPLRDEYLIVERGHQRFFDWDNPTNEQVPAYLANMVDIFEAQHGDIESYMFSASPAPDGKMFLYWTKLV